MKKVFGYTNDFLASRLYFMITGGIRDKRVKYMQFLNVFHPFLTGPEIMKQSFIFKIYDLNGDGELTGRDLIELYKNVEEKSVIGKEIKILCDYFLEN